MNMYKNLNKKARKLEVSYSLENCLNDYETIKKIVLVCKNNGSRWYFYVNNNIRTFIIVSKDLEKLKKIKQEL